MRRRIKKLNVIPPVRPNEVRKSYIPPKTFSIRRSQKTGYSYRTPAPQTPQTPQVPKKPISVPPPPPPVTGCDGIGAGAPNVDIQTPDLIEIIHKAIKEKTPLSVTRFGDGAFHLLKDHKDFSNDNARFVHNISVNHILSRNDIYLCNNHPHLKRGRRIGVDLYDGGVPTCDCFLRDKDAMAWINEMRRRIVIGMNESDYVGMSVATKSKSTAEHYSVGKSVLDRHGIKSDMSNKIDSLFTNDPTFSSLDGARKLFQNKKIHIVTRNKKHFIDQQMSLKLGCELSFSDLSSDRSYKLVDKIKKDLIATDADIVLFSGGVYIKHLIPFAAKLGKVAIDTGSIVDAWCNRPSRGWYDKPHMSYTNWSNIKVDKSTGAMTKIIKKPTYTIDQLFFPKIFSHFNKAGNEEKLFRKLKPYYDMDKPSFFFSTQSLDHVLYNHKGIAVMIVNNSTLPLIEKMDEVKKKKDLYFISTSALMSNQLTYLGLKYVEFPWATSVISMNNTTANKKGGCVYFYGDAPNRTLYGYHIIKPLMERHFPHLKLITACLDINQPLNKNLPNGFPSFNEHELNEIYKQIFVGIRLTRFDGLSSTVQDLGLRGIKTIWNGGTPSALSYGSEQDIINHIRNEEKLIGQTDTALSEACKKYLDANDESYNYIFKTSTYTSNNETPKMFFNDKKLSPLDYYEWIDSKNVFNMKMPLIV